MAPEQREHDRSDETDEENPLVEVASGAVTFLTLAVAFGLMFLGVPYFWVAFPVGFGGLLPLTIALAKWYESNQSAERERGREYDSASGRSDDTDEALAALRERYARGDIDDVEFETRVERLLETESVDDAETLLDVDDDPAGRERTGTGRDEVERA